MERVSINPGPINSELLFLRDNHRAYHLFYKQINDTPLNIRKCSAKFWKLVREFPIPEIVEVFIRAAGFRGVLDCGHKNVDHSLITALVERWRPETNTFHLPIGEVTVTLQDVQVLWGLSVEGDVITGKERKFIFEAAANECSSLLGFAPQLTDFKGGKLKYQFLHRIMKTPFPKSPTEDECKARARVYILHMLGGILFPDSSDNAVQLGLLDHLKDIDNCRNLSWGSAALACLYRNLCRATLPHAIEIGGPMLLLQWWAWSRIPRVSPNIPEVTYFNKPYGASWKCSLEFNDTPRHTLHTYRSILSAVRENGFVWTPYQHIITSLPEMCTSGHRRWACDTYIIYWEIVEQHLPNRVMRQFSYIQGIPTTRLCSLEEHRRLHDMSRRGTSSKDWGGENHNYIIQWNNRVAVNGVFSDKPTTDEEYMGWYIPRTVRYVTNPRIGVDNPYLYRNFGGNAEIDVDGFSQMRDQMGSMMGIYPESHQYLQPFHTMSRQYLHLTHADDVMPNLPSHVSTGNVDPQFLPQHERVRRRGGMQGRGRRTAPDEPGPSNTHHTFDLNN